MNVVSNTAFLSSNREVLGLPVCDLDWAEALNYAGTLADMPIGLTMIAFLNAHNANVMRMDAGFRQALDRHVVLPDGVGVDLASIATCGRPFPANLNGTDFVPALLTYMTRPKRVGLLGARPETLGKARDNFKAHAPWHEFIAVHDGFFTDEQSGDIADLIEGHKLDILLVAMGTPKQEKWVARHMRPEHARLVMSVGALFDFVAGEVPRAPLAVRRLRMEWLYRVMQEPRRLSSRYFVGGPVFFWHVLSHSFGYWGKAVMRAVAGVRAA